MRSHLRCAGLHKSTAGADVVDHFAVPNFPPLIVGQQSGGLQLSLTIEKHCRMHCQHEPCDTTLKLASFVLQH
jgi:hypothetical protein